VQLQLALRRGFIDDLLRRDRGIGQFDRGLGFAGLLGEGGQCEREEEWQEEAHGGG
jgi:hypothetical protein